MTLGILVPTRGRPGNLVRFLKAVDETADDSVVYLRFDRDDPSLEEYGLVYERYEFKTEIIPVHGERIGLANSLNELAERASNDGMKFIGMFGDDVEPITPHWDTRLVDALDGKLGVAYGDDGLRDKHTPDLPTHYITNIEVYRRLGYLAPPTIKHLFLDNVARDIGMFLRNFQFVDVKITHHHPWAVGEHVHDQTYAEGGRNPEIRLHDRREYLKWLRKGEWKKVLG